MKGLLKGAVRLVSLQFSFSNSSLVPAGIRHKGQESAEQFVTRKSSVKGQQCLAPTECVFGLRFLYDLDEAGYQLVDAFSRNMEKDGRPFSMVRFVFVAEQYVDSSDEFLKTKNDATRGLEQLLTEAMWRARAFLNPFFKDGETVDGQYAISVNLEARAPLVDGNGKPLCQWRKDDRGQRIGDKSVPIEPRLFLRIENGDVCIKSA